MKKTILMFTISLFLLTTGATAGGFGSLATANTIGYGNGNFMGVLGLGDFTSFGGTFTYGMSKHTDGRIKLGLIDGGGDANLMFAADFKYNFISTDPALNNGPFDMALGGLFEFYDNDLGSRWLIGGQYVGSLPVNLSGGGIIEPYGRLEIRLESISGNGNGSNSELDVGFNGGVKWGLNENIDFFGEIQLDNSTNLFFGLDFRVM